MPSTEYMNALVNLYPDLDKRYNLWQETEDLWVDLEKQWDDLLSVPTSTDLINLATTALLIIAETQDKKPEQVIADAISLHANKNAGYAGQNADPWANFRLSTKFGVSEATGALIRLSDKYARMQSLRANAANDKVGESLLDTLADFAAYSLIALVLGAEDDNS